jgi:hypothetical protein
MQMFVGLQKYLTLAKHFVMFLQQAIALTRVNLVYLQGMPSFVSLLHYLFRSSELMRSRCVHL